MSGTAPFPAIGGHGDQGAALQGQGESAPGLLCQASKEFVKITNSKH